MKHHITQIKQFENKLRKLLPAQLAEDYSWCVGNFRDRHLTLFVANSGQATRLRFQQQLFLEKSRSILNAIETISVKVLYQGEVENHPLKVGRKLSAEAAASISESAKHIDDSELKAALERLSHRGEDS